MLINLVVGLALASPAVAECDADCKAYFKHMEDISKQRDDDIELANMNKTYCMQHADKYVCNALMLLQMELAEMRFDREHHYWLEDHHMMDWQVKP
jgi:hypothetical protein